MASTSFAQQWDLDPGRRAAVADLIEMVSIAERGIAESR